MAFQRAILPAVLSWADKLVMIGKYWNTYLIACQCYIYYIAYTGAPSYYRISIKELNYEENQLSFRLQSKKKFK